MLEPYGRTLLLDALRPPEGYSLDVGIGTTYSLDLLTLLTAPLAFTLFDAQDTDGRLVVDPLATLESLRRYADKLTIFCHAGRILVPAQQYSQISYLEEMVVECLPPRGRGAFHPKVWLLRFTGPEGIVVYRFLCLTRNLTFDRSWDTVLVLDGQLLDRQKGIAVNRPLGDFVRALGELAVRRPQRADVRARLDQLGEEVRRVAFELPEGFDEIRFWPLGIEGYARWPFPGTPDRILVISPFLAATCLDRLKGATKESILVSRPDSLAAVHNAAMFDERYVLSDQADPEEDADESAPADEAEGENLSGLHAKCYVMDEGWRSHVWTGSANATEAAFHQNVEFLVELGGQRSQVGVRSVLEAEHGKTGFRDLLVPFTPPAEAPSPDPVLEALKKRVEDVRTSLIGSSIVGNVTQGAEDQYSLTFIATQSAVLPLPQGVNVRFWPATIAETNAVPVSCDAVTFATFSNLSLESLSAFLGVEVMAREGDRQLVIRFVLYVPLEGAPSDRRERLLRSFLRDEHRLFRYLFLLLAEEGLGLRVLSVADESRKDGDRAVRASSGPQGGLLEALLRTLDRAPERLDSIARLVEDLSINETQPPSLPPRFEEIWRPIWEARERMRQ